MKRRAISFLTVLALCLSLCPMRALAASGVPSTEFKVPEDSTFNTTYVVEFSQLFDTQGYSYTIKGQTAVRVQSKARLYLTHGTIQSTGAVGIEVQTGCFLCVQNPGMTVIGATYGLDLASGATAQLSGGTFTGQTAAIRVANNDYAALLASTGDIHYAYFDENGAPITLFGAAGNQITTNVTKENTLVVKECTGHVYEYTANDGKPTHNGTCIYCGAKVTDVPCTFNFNIDGKAACEDNCGHTIQITINVGSLEYDGTPKPVDDPVTVVLDNGKTAPENLTQNTDYTVDYEPRTDVGDFTVTVTGKTYHGTFSKTFGITRATPVITWDDTDSISGKDYDGNPIDETSLLQHVIITAAEPEYLKAFLYFSYKKTGDADFTTGLPTDAGTYDIIANLPEQTNYEAASSDPITLEINKIDPIKAGGAPTAKTLTYSGDAQELVTRGEVRDGAVVLFATSADGPWNTAIPTGTNAGTDYKVWYMVEETTNYIEVPATEIENVKIQRKPITPDVELEYSSYVYTGGEIEPVVTVRDPDTWVVLPTSEYTVTYSNNINVGGPKSEAENENEAEAGAETKVPTVTVTDTGGGNYAFTPESQVSVAFKITPKDQNGLTITGQRSNVTYGDVFVLGTDGGSGNGTVTWKITAGGGFATVDEKSGTVTVTGVGTVTVQATRTGTDYKEATAEWTFTSGPKHVTATVTADNKVYSGDVNTTVHATVEQSDLAFPEDVITITGPNGTELTGTFSDPNAGTGKTVNITDTAVFGGTDKDKYIVTIPGTTTADITKAATTVTVPTAATLIYNRGEQALLSSGAVAGFTTTVVSGEAVQVEYALSKNGPWDTVIPKATDAGTYEVWYRVKETNNYFGTTAAKVDVLINPKEITPVVTLTQDTYVYDGNEKKPAVTVKDGSVEIPSNEYTVAYSNNINAGTNTAAVTVTAKAGGNYTFTNGPAVKTFTIGKANAALTAAPQAVANLTYNGQEQNLVSAGSATGGHLEYALEIANVDGTTAVGAYSTAIPKGKEAKEYKVYYKVEGDGNHNGIAPDYVFVTVQPKTVSSPAITLANKTFTYTGTPQEFGANDITVKDGSETIPATEYTVTYSDNINAGTATVHIVDRNGGNYTVNGSTTFEIKKATAKFTTPPAAKTLTYNGKIQTLITAGVAEGGTAVYWLEGEPYSAALPTGTDCRTYKVFAQVLGDVNHDDSTPIEIQNVKIDRNTVGNPTVELSSTSFRYNGSEQKPTITVKDNQGNVIPENEYTVTYFLVANGGDAATDNTSDVGTYKIKIASKPDSNYSFTAESKFTIIPADQTALTITGKPSVVYYGDTIQLSTTGGSGNGTVEWSIEFGEGINIKKGESAGQFIIIGTGNIKIKAARTSSTDNYAPAEDTWEFYAYPKPVTAVVTAANKVYNGNTDAALSVAVPGTDIKITVNSGITGTFDSADVGTNKTVTFTITEDDVTVTGDGNYAITFPITGTTTASITPAPTTMPEDIVTVNTGLTYSGVPQGLISVTDGVTVVGGDLAFSLDGRNYDLNIPTAANAGTYTVRYKVLADSNHKDSEVKTVTVKIEQAAPVIVELPIADPITTEQQLKDSPLTGGKAIFDGVEVPGTFTWTNGNATLSAGIIQQEVTFTPADRVNFTTATTTVTVEVIAVDPEPDPTPDSEPSETPSSSPSTKPGTESASTQTTVRGGMASTVVNSAAGNKLVNEAIANQSENVVIKPEITGEVTKTEVSLPASTVRRIGNETDASLTVSTPVADVTIPNGALGALSNAGGTVSVVTEQVENTVVLTLTAGGKDVGNLPGGLTLTVPVEDAGPGTVAVLVYEDGTRVTVRKSVAGDGGVRIPLNGSATVEIVDNSKEFADVPAENWAADAVAFASAHEMFNGTSETTFSPELSMSRAMLATVLYNLESNPDTAFNGAFADVGGDTWYTESVSWAASCGIVTGYGNGSFGANDSITREQLAVMLWRYAGCPAAGKQALDFTDADQTSGYAKEALAWAAANGILNGYGNGRIDPTGLATRAQAAQMLKNFIENT